MKMTSKKTLFKEAKQKILEFLKRPDHSVTLPGKKDTLAIHNEKNQRVQLMEFLHVLHKLYNQEFPGFNVGNTLFTEV